jgi:hypothetical protein
MDTTTASRKVVVAKYTAESVFVIPKGLDLEDDKVVTQWYVKWDVLHVFKADGTLLKIEPHVRMGDDAQKYPDEEDIRDAEEGGVDESELSDDE